MTRFTISHVLGVLLVCVAPTASVQAADPLNVTIEDNVYSADLQVPGGFSAKLTVAFENVVGLRARSLNVTAFAVDPLDPTLLGRLGTAVEGIPAAFPLLVRIEPNPHSGLSFSGIVEIELYTHDLEFGAASPLRLYSSPPGGAFSDVTTAHGAGSYRSKGTKGSFSDFLIVAETRTPLLAASDKLASLDALLSSHASQIDAATYVPLSNLVAAARDAFAAGNLVAAVTYVEEFGDAVKNADEEIPNVWAAARSLTNVAGELRAAAGTTRFSLTLALNN
ncbi:MAG: DUF6689 family protein [Woeseiaceae bacterium]